MFFFFKQKTAYEMRMSDWSSDVGSSDLLFAPAVDIKREYRPARRHLAHRQLILRVARQVWIEQARHPGFEEAGYLQRILALPHDAKLKRLQALEHDPGIERAERGAGVAGERQQRVQDEILADAHRARKHRTERRRGGKEWGGQCGDRG